MKEREDDRREEAEDLFARWMEEKEAGQASPFEEFLARHAEHARALERLFARWEKLPSMRDLEPGAPAELDRYSGPSSLGDSSALLVPKKRIGRYELDHELGRGGMGVVWLARDLVLGDGVALKFLPQVLTTDRIAMLRLRREAKVLLALTHVHIVRLRTVESIAGLAFLVEEFLAGPTLAEVLEERIERDERGLSADEIRWLLEQVAPALEYAHQEGVTHRDLKPSNMMLDSVPAGELGAGKERVKLTDFGLAFVASSALSQISTYRPSGTLPYMAPEVLMGGKPTPAADIYSLGVTIYCLVAGKPPYTHGDIAAQILHARPEPLDSGDAHVDSAVRAAMRKNPADRPASALEFLAILRGEKRATSPSRGPLLRRVGLFAGAAVLAGAGWFAWRELGGPEPPERGVAAAPPEPALAPVEVRLEPPFADAGQTVFTAQRALELRGRITNPRARQFRLISDGAVLSVEVRDDGTFEVTPPGTPSSIRIEVEGAEPLRFQVEFDAEKPGLTLVSPRSNPWTTPDESLDLEVRVEERNLASLRLGELVLEPREGDHWIARAVRLQPGDNELGLTAEDKAGNASSLSVTVRREASAVGLLASEPAENATVYLHERTPLLLAFDHPIESASFAGQVLAVAADGRSATGEFTPGAPGAWRGAWSARDAAGRPAMGELSLTVLVRGRAPVVDGRTFAILDATPGWDRWARRVQDPESQLVFRLVDPGAFRMGSRPLSARMDEEPWREVRISRPYYLAEAEVTCAEWQAFDEQKPYQTSAVRAKNGIARAPGEAGAAQENPAASWQRPEPAHPFQHDATHPVTQVSWHDARAFCAHFGLRLPTEAEWERACRAGMDSTHPWGERARGAEVNLADAALRKSLPGLSVEDARDDFAFTAPVRSFAENPWGFHDMLGNVWEWCEDAYDPAAYRTDELDPLAPIVGDAAPAIALDPVVTSNTSDRPRVLRGGSWLTPPSEARPARRAFDFPDRASDTRGFRPAFTPDAAAKPEPVPSGPGPAPSLPLNLYYPGGEPRLSLNCARDDEGNLVAKGEFKRSYPNKKLAERGDFESGRRVGGWREYHPNGKTRASGSYLQDRRQKSWLFWYPDDTVRAKGEYSQGWPTGGWSFSKPDGTPDPLHSGTYGALQQDGGKGATLDGKPHGWWMLEWPDGLARFEGLYRKGLRTGPWRFWHAEGTYDPAMLSGTYEDDARIALGDEPWLPPTEDFAPPPVRSRELGALAALLGADDSRSSKYADRLKKLCEAGESEVHGILGGLGQPAKDAGAPLVRMLLALDLADAGEVVKGERLMTALARVCNQRTFPWRRTHAAEDQAFNRLQVLRTTSLWLLTRGSALYWELELAARGSPDDPILATAEDPTLARVLQNPLLYAPPQYGQPGNPEARRPAGLGQKGGSPPRSRAVDSALVWLDGHQSKDGSWDCDGFPARCDKSKGECGGVGSAAHDVGVTGLALLAFLGAGNDALEGQYKDTVRRGVLWLLEQQGDDGMLGEMLAGSQHDGRAFRPAPDQVRAPEEPQAPFDPGTKTCPTCFGTGMDLVSGGQTICQKCNGKGEVPANDPEDGLRGPRNLRALAGRETQSSAVPSASSSNVYDHAIATQALCKAFAATPADCLRRAAQRGANHILAAQNPYLAWRYGIRPDGDNDTSVTTWMVHALASARDAGLIIDQQALTNAMTWIDEMTDVGKNSRSYGRTGYTDMGGYSSRDPELAAQFPPEYTEAMTAAGVLARFLCGRTADEDPLIDAGADRLLTRLPRWEDHGSIDFYYWYFGTLAMSKVKGPRWDRWNEALKTTIVDHQRIDGSEHELGSWDPVDPWSPSGGRVYATAILALALEATQLRPR